MVVHNCFAGRISGYIGPGIQTGHPEAIGQSDLGFGSAGIGFESHTGRMGNTDLGGYTGPENRSTDRVDRTGRDCTGIVMGIGIVGR